MRKGKKKVLVIVDFQYDIKNVIESIWNLIKFNLKRYYSFYLIIKEFC